MNHQIGIHPADFSGVHIGDLQDVVVLGFPGTSSAMNDLAHPPVLIASFPKEDVAANHHGHPWFHIQEQRSLSSLLIYATVSEQRL